MILLTGGTGQLGRSILANNHFSESALIAPVRQELALENKQSVEDFLSQYTFDAIINAGAYTAVDQAESDVERAKAINEYAPTLFAGYCKKNNIPLIHISTDYVFSGHQDYTYQEFDQTDPLGVYGQTKLAGESAVLASGCRFVILRTAWVVSPYGKNFIKTMLRLASDRDEIRVVSDQRGCPTGAGDLAAVVLKILEKILKNENAPQGIYHYTNQGETSWSELARHVMKVSAKLGGPQATITDIVTAEYPTPAQRPKNSRLNCEKIKRDWQINIRPWQNVVDEIVTDLLNDKGYMS